MRVRKRSRSIAKKKKLLVLATLRLKCRCTRRNGARPASFEENCLQWRKPIAEVSLYAQMNELRHEEYNFKGTRFPLALLAFTRETNRARKGAKRMGRAEVREDPGLQNAEQIGKKENVSLPSATKKLSAFQHSCKVYFAPYKCGLVLSSR